MTIKRKGAPEHNVFLSWAGDRSRQVARAFRDWLPSVLQAAQPFMSEVDIEKGAPWDDAIMRALRECSVGIIFVTAESLESRYVASESGALALSVESRVCTLLLDGMKPSDVTGPLTRHQHTQTTKEDVQLMLETIWTSLGEPIEKEHLIKSFDWSWADLAKKLVPSSPPTMPVPRRNTHDLVEEVLDGVRELLSRDQSRGLRFRQNLYEQAKQEFLRLEDHRRFKDIGKELDERGAEMGPEEKERLTGELAILLTKITRRKE